VPGELETRERSVRLGILLFTAFVLLFGGTVLVAFLYLHFD
jgi:hypothetical protein